jgi:hypothetical protein
MTILSAWLFFLLQPGKDFCALQARVTDVAGNTISVPYEVKNNINKTVQSGISANGVIRVCDIGWQGYSLTVGAKLCGRTTIDYLELHWGQTTNLHIVYQSCHANIAFNGCRILLRALNSKGVAVTDSSIRMASDSNSCATDVYGRCLFSMAYSTEEKFKIVKDSAVVSTVSISCVQSSPLIERDVVVP